MNEEAHMTDIPWIVSLDDHVVEPPDLWTSRLPAKYRDVGPRIVMAPSGTPILDGGGYIEAPGTDGPDVAWWFYEDHQYSVKRLIAAAGYPPDEIGMEGITYDQMRPGCWQPKARIDDMTMNHVEGSLSFPNYPRFCGQLFMRGHDKELARLCVEAYNDWQVEEWCAGSGGRLIPLCLVPLWDVDLAAAEVRRNAARGVRAVAFSELPRVAGPPEHPHRLLGTVLPGVRGDAAPWWPCTSARARRRSRRHPTRPTRCRRSTCSPTAPRRSSTSCSPACWCVTPTSSSSTQKHRSGGSPTCSSASTTCGRRIGAGARASATCPSHPSQYYYRQVISCFFKDSVGVQNLDLVGRHNIAFETDYPHQDSTWPNTHQVAKELFGHLDDQTVFDIVRGNAIRLLDLQGLGDGTGPRS